MTYRSSILASSAVESHVIRSYRACGFFVAMAALVAGIRCNDAAVTPPPSDLTPPQVQITAPADGAVLTGSPLCSAVASDAQALASMSFTIRRVDPGGTDPDDVVAASGPLTTPPFEFTWATSTAPNGAYRVVALALDAAGNTAADTVAVTLQLDREPPDLVMVSPLENEAITGFVFVHVTVTDASAIDSVRIRCVVPNGPAIVDSLFTTPPYNLFWNTNALPQAAFQVCAEAVDALGYRAAICHTVHVYPNVQLVFDDNEVDVSRGFITNSWQIANVFQNPYDVPLQIDTVEFFIDANTVFGAPFRFVLWLVDNHAPTSENEGTPVLAIRNPRGTFGYFTGWNTVVPPHGFIAAGMQQMTDNLVAIGCDTDSPFRDRTFYITSPAGTRTWADIGVLGDRIVPMIRVYGKPFLTSQKPQSPASSRPPRYSTRATPAPIQGLPLRAWHPAP